MPRAKKKVSNSQKSLKSNKASKRVKAATAEKETRQALVITGMHRSGTSALTRILNLHGVDLPSVLIGSNEGNPTGHWESLAISALNDQILTSGGGAWDDWGKFNPDWKSSLKADEFREKARELISTEYGDSNLIIMKDPRICRLADFWQGVLEDNGFSTKFISPIRNPAEVSASLNSRDHMDEGYALLLWLGYVLDAEELTRGSVRVFTSFEQMQKNWGGLIQRIEDSISLNLPRKSNKVTCEVNEFLTSDLLHHNVSSEVILDNPRVSSWLKDVYRVMLKWSHGDEDQSDYKILDKIREDFYVSSSLFSSLSYKGNEASVRIESERRSFEEQQRQDQAEISKLSDDHKQLSEKFQISEQAMSEYESEISDLQAKLVLARKNEEFLERVESEYSETKANLEKITEEARDAKNQYAQLQSELSQRAHEASELHEELEATRKRENEEILALVKQNRELSDLVSELKLKADMAQKQYDESVAYSEGLSEKLEERFTELEILTANLEEYRQASVNSEKQVAEVQAKLSEAQSNAKGYELELANVHASSEEMIVSLQKTERSNVQLEKENAQLNSRMAERFEEIALLTEMVNDVDQQSADGGCDANEELTKVMLSILKRNEIRRVPSPVRFLFQKFALMRSGMFDPNWYLERYSDVRELGVDPYRHYIQSGVYEGRLPGPLA